MRLDVLNHGYRPTTRLLFALIRLFSGHPAPDAARIVFYRPDFYGTRAKQATHEAMRGPSTWSVADRELMAAYVAHHTGSTFCTAAHTATAAQAFGNEPMVTAALTDPDTAPIAEPLRATLRMLGTLIADGTVSATDMRQVLAAGATRQQIQDALAVCAAFDTTARLADAFGFEVLSPEGFEAGARYLLKRGYR